MKAIRLFLLMAMAIVALCPINAYGQLERLETEKDGFKWYRIDNDGIYGAKDANGRTIIPLSRGYTSISYFKGYLTVMKNGLDGLCNKQGEEIIPPQYSLVFSMDSFFYAEKQNTWRYWT